MLFLTPVTCCNDVQGSSGPFPNLCGFWLQAGTGFAKPMNESGQPYLATSQVEDVLLR